MTSGSAVRFPVAPQSRRRFSRRDRVCRRAEFVRIYAEGRRAGTKAFVLYLLPSTTGSSRLGIAVPRRIGSAVKRNRVKRRLREAFRLHRHRFPGCFDIVVNARDEVAEMPFGDLVESLVSAVRRASRSAPGGGEPPR